MAKLRDGETRDDTHAARNLAQLREAGDGDPCPDCEDGTMVRREDCPVCRSCGYSPCGGEQA